LFCWEYTGILPNYVSLININEHSANLIIRALVCLSNVSNNFSYLYQYLPPKCQLYSQISSSFPFLSLLYFHIKFTFFLATFWLKCSTSLSTSQLRFKILYLLCLSCHVLIIDTCVELHSQTPLLFRTEFLFYWAEGSWNCNPLCTVYNIIFNILSRPRSTKVPFLQTLQIKFCVYFNFSSAFFLSHLSTVFQFTTHHHSVTSTNHAAPHSTISFILVQIPLSSHQISPSTPVLVQYSVFLPVEHKHTPTTHTSFCVTDNGCSHLTPAVWNLCQFYEHVYTISNVLNC